VISCPFKVIEFNLTLNVTEKYNSRAPVNANGGRPFLNSEPVPVFELKKPYVLTAESRVLSCKNANKYISKPNYSESFHTLCKALDKNIDIEFCDKCLRYFKREIDSEGVPPTL
jgi:hypothetical protein